MKTAAYNLFAPLLGKIENWYSHIDRVSSMGFSLIYLNPLTYPGFSGSLYAAKYYYKYNPSFFGECGSKEAEEKIKKFNNYAREKNIKVMIDLVINHSSKDSPLTEEHKNWYKLENGNLVSPGAWDNGKWVEWGDLASFDNENSEDIENLYNYWFNLIKHNIELGFSGFRCDAAYKVPSKLWKYLIKKTREIKKDTIFFAESLGCSLEDTVTLAESGFDYVASSARWWDYEGKWFIEQYNKAIEVAKQISFPENHDTERLITEYNGNIFKVKQIALFTAIVCDIWMITYGFEYGFKKRCDVVTQKESDREEEEYDLSNYIKRLTEYVKDNKILSEEGRLVSLEVEEEKEMKGKLKNLEEEKIKAVSESNEENKDKAAIEEIKKECEEYLKKYEEDKKNNPFKKMYKYSVDGKEKLFIVINNTAENKILEDIKKYKIEKDISFGLNKELDSKINLENTINFEPYEIKIFSMYKD